MAELSVSATALRVTLLLHLFCLFSLSGLNFEFECNIHSINVISDLGVFSQVYLQGVPVQSIINSNELFTLLGTYNYFHFFSSIEP